MLRVGHRGWPHKFPPNTLAGFAAAWEAGCQMVECDVSESADGVLVLAHDPHVTDTSGTAFSLSETPAADLAALNLGAGQGVPTLQSLMDWARQTGCAVMADMKCEGGAVEAGVVAVLSTLPNSQKIVPGAGAQSRARFRALQSDLPLSLSLGRNAPELQTEAAFENILSRLDTPAVTWEWPTLTAERVARLHAHNVRVLAWTVDDAQTMRDLVFMGVDGIISNCADLLSAL